MRKFLNFGKIASYSKSGIKKDSCNKYSFATIFDKVISKEIPAEIVFEDKDILAFKDVNPQYPVHILLIPKKLDGLSHLSKAEGRHQEILGKLMLATKKVAEIAKIDKKGYRVVINNGDDGGQTVEHIHLHLVGGCPIGWPPGRPRQFKV